MPGLALAVVLGLFSLGLTAQSSGAPGMMGIAGIWEGESTCTIPDSPCHDEHVLYDLKADPQIAGHFSLDAYKLAAGKRDFMGTLDCHYTPAQPILRCVGRRPDDVWKFAVSGDKMAGTLTIGADEKLYRKIQVRKNKGQ